MDRMSKAEFYNWLDTQIPNADDLRTLNPWMAYEAAKAAVKRIMKDWVEYDYYLKMITGWAGVYR
jgi:hypothetical protein